MNCESAAPFESIESAQEYLRLLGEVVLEAQRTVEADVEESANSGTSRRTEALQLITYILGKLSHHIKYSHRLLNDLRTLRRLIQQERTVASFPDHATAAIKWNKKVRNTAQESYRPNRS